VLLYSMSRLFLLLVVSSTLLLLTQARQDKYHGKPPAKYPPPPKYQSYYFVPEKKDWSQYSEAEQQKWKITYKKSSFEKIVPWMKVSDDLKAFFAHLKIRKNLATKRRELKKKLISKGKFDPRKEFLVFENPEKLMAWTVTNRPNPGQVAEPYPPRHNKKDVPKRANFEDTLRKLKNQLSEAEKKITAGKKLADAQKTLLDAVLSTPGKIVGNLLGGRNESLAEVVRKRSASTGGNREGKAGIEDLLPPPKEDQKPGKPAGEQTDAIAVILRDIAGQLVTSLTSFKSLLDGFISQIGGIPFIGPVLTPFTDIFQEISDFLAFMIESLEDFIDGPDGGEPTDGPDGGEPE